MPRGDYNACVISRAFRCLRDEATVKDRLEELRAAGVDEYVGAVFDTSAEGRARTRAVLRQLDG
jgi:hypothetical protein